MKKKIKINKRDVIILIVIACIVVFACAKLLYKKVQEYKFANQMETISQENENSIFAIDKIVLYSSASAIDNSEGETMQDLNVLQFTDIAIYLDNTSYIEELSAENTIKELYIDNINIQEVSSKGEKSLTYKNVEKYGRFEDEASLEEAQTDEQEEQSEQLALENVEENTSEEAETTENEVVEEEGKIYYNVIQTNENNEKSDYNIPTYYTDCSNPITLTYLNKDIVTGYSVSTDDQQIVFDGSILQSVGVSLEDIECRVSFTIHLKNNLDQEFQCDIGIDIPLTSETRSIYDGYIYIMESNLQDTYSFFKI